MKILLVNDMAVPSGGAEMLTFALRDGLLQRGFDARIFASSADVEGEESGADYTCFGTTGPLRSANRVANLSAARALKHALEDFQPDVVHVRMFLSQLSPLILPLLRRTPTLYHATWHEMVCPTGHKLLPDDSICWHRAGAACWREGCLSLRAWGPLLAQLQLARRWRGALDLVVANSEYLRERLLADGMGPVEVVWNGVPEVEVRPPLGHPPTVTCAGRLSREKGLDHLVRAFAGVVERVPEARLLVAGSGPEREALERSIGALGLQESVTLLGRLEKAEMEQAFRVGWVHVVPSLCAETFGLTAAEAMMRGTAVVASRAGGLAEIIEPDETGLLVPPGDVEALRDALVRVLCDRGLAERMGQRGLARARDAMNEAGWIDRFVGFYQQLVATGGVVAEGSA